MAAARRFIAVRTDRIDIGLDAPTVLRVELWSDWNGSRPLDIEQLLAFEPPSSCRRVLVIDSEAGSYAIGTGRDLVLRDCPVKEICEVPSLVWHQGTKPLVSGVAVLPDVPPLLILDREVLGECVAAQPSLEGVP